MNCSVFNITQVLALTEQKEWFNYDKQILSVFSCHDSLACKYQVILSLDFSVLEYLILKMTA